MEFKSTERIPIFGVVIAHTRELAPLLSLSAVLYRYLRTALLPPDKRVCRPFKKKAILAEAWRRRKRPSKSVRQRRGGNEGQFWQQVRTKGAQASLLNSHLKSWRKSRRGAVLLPVRR